MQIQITRQNVFDLMKSSLIAQNNQLTTQLLERARVTPGFCLQLLVLADDKETQFQIRQAALVTLKTTIDTYYFSRDGKPSQIAESDKVGLRGSIIQALERNISQTKLVATISEIIYLMALEDYPGRWDVSDEIAETLKTSENFSQIFSHLLALKSIFSVYNENNDSYKKGQLVSLILKTFPPMQALTSKLMANYNQVSETILLCILKIFGKATYTELVYNLKNSSAMHNWYIFLKKILDFKVENPSALFIKIKNRSLKILLRFIQRHANPKYDRAYSEIFKDKYSRSFLESVVLILMTMNNNSSIFHASLATLPYFYRNFENCKALLEQHKEKLLALAVGKCLISQEDIALWADDPVEFINKEKEARKTLVEFVRSYDHCGIIVGNEIGNAFKTGDENLQEISLYLLAEMRNEIMADVQEEHVVNLFVDTIFPLLISGSPILKARACSAIASFIEDIAFPPATIQLVTSKIFECFNSKELQIKVPAAKALATIIEKYEEATPMLQPFLTQILQGYLAISEKVDSEEVVYSLQKIINKMSESLEPFASDLFKALMDLFLKYCERMGYLNDTDPQNDNDPEENENEENASDTCLGSIRSILHANLSQKFYTSVSPQIYNLVSFILSEKSYNFLQEGLNILNLYLFKTDQIHPDFMKLFPLLCYMITSVPQQVLSLNLQSDPIYCKMIHNITQGVDRTIVQNIIGSMRNFIAKTGSPFFSLTDIAGVTFINRIFETVSAIKSEGSYANIGYVSTLLTTIIENNLGNIDDIVTLILNFIIKEINSESISTKLLTIHLQIVFICLYYNPLFTIKVLDQSKCTDFIFKGIISNPQLFKSEFEKKRLVIGSLRLLQIDQNTLASSSVGVFVPELVKITVELAIEAYELRVKDADSEESECQDDQTLQFPQNPTQQQLEAEEESDDQIEEWASQYNKLYCSPIDSINQTLLLGNFLLEHGQNYLQFLTEESQSKMSEIMVREKTQVSN